MHSSNGTDFFFHKDEEHLKNVEKNFYGSTSFNVKTQSEEIFTPEIVTQENDSSKSEIKEIENNINNDIVASKYEILKEISVVGNEKINSNFICELNNGYIVISNYDKKLLFFDNKCLNKLTIKFPFMINSINEINNTESNKIKIFACSTYSIYIVTVDLLTNKSKIEKCNLSEEEKQLFLHDFNKNNDSNIKTYNYHYILKLKNNKYILCTNYGIYECYNLDNSIEKMPKIVLLEQYIEGAFINDNLICFKSNKQLTNGEDLLTIFNLYSKKIIEKIDNYSFSISPYRLILLTQNEKKKTLICACTKYSSDQKNGILLVNFEFNGSEEFKTKVSFEEIESFSVNCICKLNNKIKDNEIFLMVGGVDEEYNKGMVKLYKLEFNENEINIEYLQNIELGDNIEGSISYICQLKNGKIIVSCGNGNILFTAPNLDGYNDEDF